MHMALSALNNSTVVGNCTGRVACSDPQAAQLTLFTVITLSTVNISASLIGTFGNVLVLVAVVKYSCIHTSPDFFIFSLASADLLVTVAYQPMFVVFLNEMYNGIQRSKTLQLSRMFVGYFALLASVTSLCAVSVDRLVSVRRPLKYALWRTKRLVAWILGIIWLVSAALAAIYSFIKPDRIFIWTYQVIMLTAILIMYSYIFAQSHKQKQKISNISKSMTNSQRNLTVSSLRIRLNALNELKATKTIGLICGIYIATCLPLFLYSITADRKWNRFKEGLYWALTASLCNSFCNPYIYCIGSHRYRRTISKLLGIKYPRFAKVAEYSSKTSTTCSGQRVSIGRN